jgi:hypothetical protein
MPPDAKLIEAVAGAIASAWEDGCPVAHHDAARRAEMAARALRRWNSSARRGIDREDRARRVRDLAEGLVAATERDPGLAGPLIADYEHLARRIAAVIPAE